MILLFVILCVSFVLAHRSASAHRCEPLCNNHLRVSHRETQRSHKEPQRLLRQFGSYSLSRKEV